MRSIKPVDAEQLKVPAFMRRKAIVTQSRQQLINTALDRKQAGLKPNSTVALGNIKRPKGQGILDRALQSVKAEQPQGYQTSQRASHTVQQPSHPGLRPSHSGPRPGTQRLNAITTPRTTAGPTRPLLKQASISRFLRDEVQQMSAPQQPAFFHLNDVRQEQQSISRPAPRRIAPPVISTNVQEAPAAFENGQKLLAIGTVTHFLDKISVAIIKLTAPLKTGEQIILSADGYLFIQNVEEIQIDRKPVPKAKKGDHIGLKVEHTALVNSAVYALR